MNYNLLNYLNYNDRLFRIVKQNVAGNTSAIKQD